LLELREGTVSSGDEAGVVLAEADPQRLGIMRNLSHDTQPRRVAGKPCRGRVDLHHGGDLSDGEVGYCIIEPVERIHFDAFYLPPYLHSDRHVVIGGGGLNADGRLFEVGQTEDAGRPYAVDDNAERRRHVGIGPSQQLLPRGGDSDSADDAVVAAFLHLLQDRLPLRVHE